MSDLQFPDHRVLEVIVWERGTMLDDIVLECPELTWNQVFVVIDRLSLEGALTMSPKGRGHHYAITFPSRDHPESLTTQFVNACRCISLNNHTLRRKEDHHEVTESTRSG